MRPKRVCQAREFAILLSCQGFVELLRAQGVASVAQGFVALVALEHDLQRGRIAIAADQQILVQHASAQFSGRQRDIRVLIRQGSDAMLDFVEAYAWALEQGDVQDAEDGFDPLHLQKFVLEGCDLVQRVLREEIDLGGVGDDHKIFGSIAPLYGFVVSQRFISLEHHRLLRDIQLEVLGMPGEPSSRDEGQGKGHDRMLEDQTFVDLDE